MTKILFALFTTFIFTLSAGANSQIARSTKDTLTYMQSIYGTFYAPAPWKAEFDNLNMEQEYTDAIARVEATAETMTVADARKILSDYIYATRDYHVSMTFFSTEEAKLHFVVRSAEGRFFIVHIDRTKLDEATFPFNVGDEVISFDGKPVAEVVNALKIKEENVAETDQALAEFALTNRRSSRGFEVPRGTVEVEVKKKGSETLSKRQLIWDYKQENVSPFDPKKGKKTKAPLVEEKPLIEDLLMTADLDLSSEKLNPQGLGDRKGFLPNLGDPIWEASDENDLYRAYIYQENGENIGVIRIPGYIVSDYDASIKNFAKLVSHLEKHTSKLVIDQLNNPGGSVFYLYALASILSDQPLRTPLHIMSLTPARINTCVNVLDQLEGVTTNEQAQQKVGKTISGYPVSLQFVDFYREYCRMYISEWESGKVMTRPFWIAGVDQINPYPNNKNYTKPILILVNELDFSGGDFFPTIMQDNKRAKILGVRTAGAGGYVLNYSFPNLLGVQGFRVTESLAYRLDQTTIENLGVTPDINVSKTANDLQNNYVDYIKSVKEALKELN